MKLEQRSLSDLKKRLSVRLAELDTQENHFLDLVGDASWPKAKIVFGKIRLDAHDPEGRELEAFVASHELTDGIDALVEVGSPAGSRYSVSTRLTPDSKRDPIPEDGVSLDDFAEADLLAAALSGHGSNKGAVVELRGIEPLTSSMRTRRATNCATAPGGTGGSLAGSYSPTARR